MLAEQLGYQPFGPLKSLTWGNGLTLSRSFDQSYRLTGQQVGSWSSDYAFDANGNITGLDQSLWGSLQYGYDALDRLSLEQKSAEKKTYVYDATGNRTARVTYSLANGVQTQTAKQSLTYNGNSNRLNKRSTSYAVEVDIAGHYTRYSQNRRYTYNEQGRLSTVTDADGGLMATYSYNALGQRVLKTLPTGASWTFLYGPDGQLLGQEQYSASTGKKLKGQYWVWLDAMPLAGVELSFNSAGAVSSSNLYYLHADHLNTPRLASNQNQALVWSWASDAFGVGVANQDVDGNGITTDIPLRFPGQQYDAHSALHYNYFRDYDPETGRYVESDPIGLDGGINTYGYVEGNPLIQFDTYGLASDKTALMSAIARGDTRNIRTILDALSDPKLRVLGEQALKKFSSKADDWIVQNCKGSINREFPDYLRDKTLEEIRKGNSADYKKAWKLLNDKRFQK